MQNKRAFTLIELLVVVLIIGFLAAVALPQYQKAIEKSKATQALALLKALGQAAETYYLENNMYPKTFEEFDVNLPTGWTGTTSFYGQAQDHHSNGEWSIGMENREKYRVIYIGKITGKYAGAGFYLASKGEGIPEKEITCVETISNGVVFKQKAGDYCEKIMNGKYKISGNHRIYSL